MIEKKNQYYIVKDGTKTIYKGKDKKKAEMYESHLISKEDARERRRNSEFSMWLTRGF